MTLLTILQKRFIIVIAFLMLLGSGIYAKTPKKFTLNGVAVDDMGEGIKKAEVNVLFDGESVLKKPGKTKKKGDFSVTIKKFEPGDYIITASHNDAGNAELVITLTEDALEEKEWKKGKKDIGEMFLSTAVPEPPVENDAAQASQGAPETAMSAVTVPSLEASKPRTPEATGIPSKHFIVNELSFEIKRLSAEFKHLNQELNDLKA